MGFWLILVSVIQYHENSHVPYTTQKPEFRAGTSGIRRKVGTWAAKYEYKVVLGALSWTIE